MRLDQVPRLGGGYLPGLVLRAGSSVVLVGAVDNAAVGQVLHVVGVVFDVFGREECARGGIAGTDGT